MGIMSRYKRSTRTAMLGTALAMVAAACGSGSSSSSGGQSNTASAPGITPTSIKLGTTQPLTGPAAPGYKDISAAAKSMFDWQNAHGGVNGRQINLTVQDDGYNPANTSTLTRKMVLQDQVFADFDPLGTPTQLSVQPFLNTQKVPQVMIASGCICWNQPQQYPWSWGWQPNYVIEGKILGKYIKENLAGKKVGYIYQDDDFGQDGVKGLDSQLTGSTVVARQTYVASTLAQGMGNQVGALKAAGAEVIAIFGIPAAVALSHLAAVTTGYNPAFVVSSVGADIPTLSALLQSISKGKAGAAVLEGQVSNGYLPAPDDDTNGWVAFFKKVWQQYDAQNQPVFTGNVEYGLAVAYTFIQALKAAGQNPTRQSLADALNKNSKSLAGAELTPLSYSSSNHSGIQGSEVVMVKGGKFVKDGPGLGKPYETTVDGPISDSTYTPPSPPSS